MLDIQSVPTPQMRKHSRVRDWLQCNIRVEPRIERTMEELRSQLNIELFSGLKETVTRGGHSFTNRQLRSKSSFLSALVKDAVVQMAKEPSADQPIQE